MPTVAPDCPGTCCDGHSVNSVHQTGHGVTGEVGSRGGGGNCGGQQGGMEGGTGVSEPSPR